MHDFVFNNYDITALCLYLILIVVVGVACGGRKHSPKEFYTANRSMGWFPVGVSVMITVFSAINFVAFPTEIAKNGLYVLAALPAFIFVAFPITRIFIPFFYKMNSVSAYEFLEERFDLKVRLLASGLFVLWRLLWMAIVLYATAKILSLIFGVSLPILIILSGGVAMVYTVLGGIRAVIWTDVAQFFVLFGGVVVCLLFANNQIGGDYTHFLSLVEKGRVLKPFFPFDSSFLSFDPTIRITLWSCFFGVFVAFMTRYGADQIVIQRYFAAKSLSEAQKGFWLNTTCAIVVLVLLAFLGVALYAYGIGVGLISDGEAVCKPLIILSHMIKHIPYGGCGLLAAALIAATMSSIDSGINACSAAFFNDFYLRFSRKKSEVDVAGWRITIILSLIIGTLSIALAIGFIGILGQRQTVFVMINKIIHGIGSPLLAIILLAMFSKRISCTGVFWGGLLGIVASICTTLFCNYLALHYYALLNLLITLAFCYGIDCLARRH
jgi:SSS family transporter